MLQRANAYHNVLSIVARTHFQLEPRRAGDFRRRFISSINSEALSTTNKGRAELHNNVPLINEMRIFLFSFGRREVKTQVEQAWEVEPEKRKQAEGREKAEKQSFERRVERKFQDDVPNT